MKVYAVIGKFDYEGETVEGIWTRHEDATRWLYSYLRERKEEGYVCNYDELCFYEVEGTQFTKLREWNRDLKQVWKKV